ncbi:TRM11 family SAM-dependent methyltransferase [Anaeroselena agilis]|uniref:site-specific DNA-methyltransferase (cytosine-N(4)-specific) n=1 Tax=Anaeroselena agilis TaxID=3063788 RepID=A0ABU3P2I4_9FIRM|nr:DNA methyltransferase [Selenomonadales bacterium 4137-cl]
MQNPSLLKKNDFDVSLPSIDRLENKAHRLFQYGQNAKEIIRVSPFVINGPIDQNWFHNTLISLQEQSEERIPWELYRKRLSLIESTGFTEEPTSLTRLESPKKDAKSWNSNYGPHGWHRYVGRFPPHLVRALLNHFQATQNDIVLDPFVGSGTTLVECRLLGIPSIGIEICPLSSLIARTKSKFPMNTDSVSHIPEQLSFFYSERLSSFLRGRLINEIPYEDILSRPGNLISAFPNYQNWFTRDALLGVSIVTEFAATQQQYARDIILIALSSKMRSIGNVDVDVVRAEYSKKPKENVDVLQIVIRQLSKMLKSIQDSLVTHRDTLVNEHSVSLLERDVLEVDLPEASVSHVITSPPYGVEAISYLRTHLLSYRTLEQFLETDPYEFGQHVIGSEYLPKNPPHVEDFLVSNNSQTYRSFFSQTLGATLSSKHHIRTLMMMKFFEDMNMVASKLRFWMRSNGRVAFVIGNKKIGDTIIPNDIIMKEIFEANGFVFDNAIRHKLKTNNSNSQVPWQERVIQEEYIMLFHRRSSR